MKAHDISGRVFVVTGAGNGIGRQVAIELIARGAVVAGVDVREPGLTETAGHVADGTRFSAHVVDVGDASAVAMLPESVLAAHGRVDGLFNIAGIAQEFETVAGVSDERIEQLMRVNFFGTVTMTRAFLPLLQARPDGGFVLITSSLSALVPYPGAAIYGASKAAVALFGYGLAHDLRGSGSAVRVTTVIPGTVWTDIVRGSSALLGAPESLARAFAMAPDKAARRIVDATLAGRRRVIIGKDAHVYSAIRRVSVSVADRLPYLQVGRFVYRRTPGAPGPGVPGPTTNNSAE